MSTVTNLTELWHDSEKDDALLLTAKPTEGSDYARFCNLCDAFAEMPFHPIRRFSSTSNLLYLRQNNDAGFDLYCFIWEVVP